MFALNCRAALYFGLEKQVIHGGHGEGGEAQDVKEAMTAAPGAAVLDNEEEAGKHRVITQAVHEHDSKICLQMLHTGRYACAREPVAPSALKAPINPVTPRAAFVFPTRRLKSEVNIPVTATNRIDDPQLAEDLLARGDADMVSMARPFLADPDFVNKGPLGFPGSGSVEEFFPGARPGRR